MNNIMSLNIKDFQINKNDTGSTKVQIILLSQRVAQLTIHAQKHRQDNHSILGLKKIVSKRRKLLKYLEKTNKAEYAGFLATIGLKK